MKKLVKLLVVLLACVCAVSLAACQKKELNKLETIQKQGYITIAVSPDYAPFEFVNTSVGDDAYVGSDIEFMKYIAKELGVELKIQAVDFDSTLSLLAAGSVDMSISGFTYKESRAEIYDFTDMYFDEGGQVILVPADCTYTTLAELANEQLGGQSASLQYDFISEYVYSPAGSDKTPTSFSLIADGVNLMKAGQLYGIALAQPVAEALVASSKDSNGNPLYKIFEVKLPVPAEQTQLYALCKKSDDKSLLNKVNEIIAKMVEEDVYEGWFEDAQELQGQLNA